MTDEVRGLKIPRSSVTDVTFYVIPKDYYVSAKKDSSDSSSVSQSGFRKETYADGKTVGVITSCTIYYADDEYYYVAVSYTHLQLFVQHAQTAIDSLAK